MSLGEGTAGRRSWWRAIIAGCGTLPHVGEHPGTGFVAMLILTGGAAGVRNGWPGVIGGASLMAIVFVPMYLWGAYDRARISERTTRATGAQ